jgi:hypothetical protein
MRCVTFQSPFISAVYRKNPVLGGNSLLYRELNFS